MSHRVRRVIATIGGRPVGLATVPIENHLARRATATIEDHRVILAT